MLSKNCKAHLYCNYISIARGKSYNLTSSVKGTQACQEKSLLEAQAIVKQLGISTFSMNLHCADLQWNELIGISSKINSLNLTGDGIKNISFQKTLYQKSWISSVSEREVKVFSVKMIVLKIQLDKIKYFAIRVELQVKVSPHIHSFIHIHAAKLT